jgi:hypothetical protein
VKRTTTTTTCDNNKCQAEKQPGQYWYQLQQDYDPTLAIMRYGNFGVHDFCSLVCLGRWVDDRLNLRPEGE